MFLTDKLIAAQREASRRVAEGKAYSVELPIVGRVPVPSPRQLAIYAALGGLAAIQAIDWPVAVAMGIGSALVSRQLTDLEEREEELAEAIEAEGSAGAKRTAASPKPATAVTAPAKKAPAKKAPAKKSAVNKAPAKKAAVTEAPAKKAAAKKAAAKKAAVKKAPAKKAPAKKAPAKKAPAKKASPGQQS